MSVRLVILFALLLCSYVGSAQHVVEGVVQDLNGKPIPYATIGIPDKNVGTYSFENGFFSLKIPEDYLQDSLMFSCIGFETISRKNFDRDFQLTDFIKLSNNLKGAPAGQDINITYMKRINNVSLRKSKKGDWGYIKNYENYTSANGPSIGENVIVDGKFNGQSTFFGHDIGSTLSYNEVVGRLQANAIKDGVKNPRNFGGWQNYVQFFRVGLIMQKVFDRRRE